MSYASDLELHGIRSLSRRLPRLRVFRYLARVLRKFYLRKPREDVVVEVAGQRMRLSPADYVEGQLLFAPQFYEPDEREYARARLRAGDVFVDLGAHVGLYTLLAARAVGLDGKVEYAGGIGPFGFKPVELQEAIDSYLSNLELAEQPAPRISELSD